MNPLIEQAEILREYLGVFGVVFGAPEQTPSGTVRMTRETPPASLELWPDGRLLAMKTAGDAVLIHDLTIGEPGKCLTFLKSL